MNKRGIGIHPLYTKYQNIIQRCSNPNCVNYHRYGGRGIMNKFKSGREFISYLYTLPDFDFGKTLDRIDNNGHYEKGNLKWSTPRQQCLNRSKKPKSGHKNIDIHKGFYRVIVRKKYLGILKL